MQPAQQLQAVLACNFPRKSSMFSFKPKKKEDHMYRLLFLLVLVTATGGVTLPVTSAYAQATRTWVSGVGDDANPCSRTAPCKTFAGAISKTAAGGEIDCLDPGGFGAVTITKPITLDCVGTLGSILASGTNAVIINIVQATFPNG